MEKEDGPSHGGGRGGDKKGKMKSTPKAKSKEVKKTSSQKLTEDDDAYPKDVPAGAKHYEKFWDEELGPVIDQGIRRICWTVASTGGFSAKLKIEGKTKTLKRLSLLHLVVGLHNKTDDNGGLRNLEYLKKFMEEEGAILAEDCRCTDPLSELKKKGRGRKADTPAPVLCTHKKTPNSVFKVKKLNVISEVVEKDLILLLDKHPVAISIVHQVEFIRFKGDGIYDGIDEDSEEDVDYHMMLCRGYGTLNGVHYWSVQNSAGVKWGENGFGKIIRETSRNGKPSLIKYIVYPDLLDEYVDED